MNWDKTNVSITLNGLLMIHSIFSVFLIAIFPTKRLPAFCKNQKTIVSSHLLLKSIGCNVKTSKSESMLASLQKKINLSPIGADPVIFIALFPWPTACQLVPAIWCNGDRVTPFYLASSSPTTKTLRYSLLYVKQRQVSTNLAYKQCLDPLPPFSFIHYRPCI